jgi:ABC-type nickel/cobalt efflux system permease component RcnA
MIAALLRQFSASWRLLICALAITVVLAPGTAALAQSASPPPAAPKSFLPPAKAAEPPSGIAARAYAWIMTKQSEINRRLAAAVRDIRTGDPWYATLLLAGLSFAYGVLHAAGPGHGKAVISSYVLANEQTVRRGIALSFLAAAFQGLSALVVVGILVLVLSATGMTMKSTEAWLETLSWGFVALVGAWLLYTQLKAAWPKPAAAHHDHGHPHNHGHAHDHGHAHAHAHHHHDGHHLHRGHDHGHHHGHHHGHDHGHAHSQHEHAADGSCCNHAHMPDPSQLQGPWSWRQAIAIALAVGIRPCTGAILVLVFAISQGLMWAGVFATFAMAIGTAITVSALAALAVGSRELAMRLGGGAESVWGARVRTAAGIGGAGLVFGLGLVLMIGSLQSTNVF